MVDGLVVRPAVPGDVETIQTLLDEAALWMIGRGITQWRPGMFPREMIRHRVDQGEAFLARTAADVVGALQLHGEDPAVWGARPPDALYLHNLVVRRRFGGRGIGRALVGWAEAETRARGRTFLRLDCVASNAVLRTYYAEAGFAERGDVETHGLTLRRWEKIVGPPATQSR